MLAACAQNTPSGGAGDFAAGSVNDPSSPAYFQARVGDRVFFAVDKSDLSPEARTTLNAQAAWLMENTLYDAIIQGHTDERGTREYNLALGARRANSVFEYLILQGVPEGRLRTVSFGKERPQEACSSEACYAQNRRSVTLVASGTGV
ncbi:MAG: peptidoglycan-associated lipoprotein Pal [Pseudomonadota bacterium]